MIHLPGFIGNSSLLLVRMVVGVSFLAASRHKAKNISKFAKNNGLSVPVASFVMVCEFAGAVGMILGIFAQLAALGLVLLMIGTIRIHIFKWKSPYWASKGGWEYDLMLLALSAVILLHGPGAYSIATKPIFFQL